MAQDDSTKTLIILGVAAVGAWYLYEQGYLYEWTGLAALYPGGMPTSVTTTTPSAPVTTTTSPAPVTTTTSPAAAAFSIQGAVTPNVNDSLTANVSINGGTPINISIIQSSAQAYNTSGQNITATLTGEGVSVPALLAAMQAAYKPSGTSGIGMFSGSRVSLGSVHGMGYARLRRGALQ